MNKHQAHDLKQMQSLPLEAKIIMTKQRIRQWYDHWDGEVYVSFSGGKDSTVLKHIVDNTSGVYDVPAVFVNTGLEYPEIQKFVKDVKAGKWDCFNSNVEILRPEMRFDEVIKKYGYPVVSKEVSKYVKDARSAIAKGKTCYYAIQKLQGTLKDKDGNKSKYNCEKWGFMLEAPYKISHQCCDVMKKRPTKKYSKQTGRKPILATMAE
jgi:3'-phosphoadenosine 5'-phosphosulfate sulfotransferase (PAPS reductase)/FAD synthetase